MLLKSQVTYGRFQDSNILVFIRTKYFNNLISESKKLTSQVQYSICFRK